MRSVVNLVAVIGFTVLILYVFSFVSEQLDKILAALESKSKVEKNDKYTFPITWRRSDEELPINSGYYLTYGYHGLTNVMFYSKTRHIWSEADTKEHDTEEIKYWAFLPEVPLDL